MKNIEKRMQDMEEKKIPAIEQDMDGAKADITTLKTQVKKLSESAKESAGVTQSSITSSVLEEMRERERVVGITWLFTIFLSLVQNL